MLFRVPIIRLQHFYNGPILFHPRSAGFFEPGSILFQTCAYCGLSFWRSKNLLYIVNNGRRLCPKEEWTCHQSLLKLLPSTWWAEVDAPQRKLSGKGILFIVCIIHSIVFSYNKRVWSYKETHKVLMGEIGRTQRLIPAGNAEFSPAENLTVWY